jgi:multidrug efflux pump subunit AcrA (membrane-fusion protein)
MDQCLSFALERADANLSAYKVATENTEIALAKLRKAEQRLAKLEAALDDAQLLADERGEALAMAVGYDPADAPPAPEQRAQIILNAERGLRGDRWIVETDGYPSILSDVWVVAWRPRRDSDGSDER